LIIETDYGDFGNGDKLVLDPNCTQSFVDGTGISAMQSDRSNGRWTPLGADTPGYYYYCYIPAYDTRMQQIIPYAQWTVQGCPYIDAVLYGNPSIYLLRTFFDIQPYFLSGAFYDGDVIYFTKSDCNTPNWVGSITYKYGDWEKIWFGWETGPVQLQGSAFPVYLTLCYSPALTKYSSLAGGTPETIVYNDNSDFKMTILMHSSISTGGAANFPSLLSYWPSHKNYAIISETETPYLQLDREHIYPFKISSIDPNGYINIRLLLWDPTLKEFTSTAASYEVSQFTVSQATNPPSYTQNDIISSPTGKVSITPGVIKQFPGNVYSYNLTRNALKYMPSPSNQYYFMGNDETVYKSVVFEYRTLDFTISESQATRMIYPFTNHLLIEGQNLDEVTTVYYTSTNFPVIETWKTWWIKVKLYITNTTVAACDFNSGLPFASKLIPTGLVSSWNNTHAQILDLNLQGCQSGNLMADIAIMRVQYDASGQKEIYPNKFRVMYRDGYQLGYIGCYSDCETCKGAGANDCIFCKDNKINEFGACVTQCSPGLFTVNETAFHSVKNEWAWRLTCAEACPFDQYPDETNFCRTCPSNCKTCTSPFVGDCTSCMESEVLYKGMCLSSCPAGYKVDLAGKTCVSEYEYPPNITVKIIESNYKDRIPWGTKLKLRVAISDTFNDVSKIEWQHIDNPRLQPQNQLGNSVFIGSRFDTSYVEIDTSLFPKDHGLAIHIIVLVTNNETVASDAYEFYLNGPPIAGTFSMNPTAGRALNTTFLVSFSNWDETPFVRTHFPLVYRIEFALPDGTRVLLREREAVPFSQDNQYNFTNVTFPMISPTEELNVKVYLIAENPYGSSTEVPFDVIFLFNSSKLLAENQTTSGNGHNR